MKAGWITTELGKVCAFENGDRGTNYPSRSVRTSEGIPFINAGHLAEAGLDYSTMDYIPRERFDLLGGGKVRSGDILFCLRGSLGKFASVGELNEGAIASSLVILRPGQHLLPSFLLLFLESALCKSMIEQYGNGAAQPNLASGSLKQFLIPLPPLPEQQRIVTLLDEAFDGITTAKANAEKNLQNVRAIFESHLQSVFTQRGVDWEEKPLGSICDRVSVGHVGPITEFYCGSDNGIAFLRSQNVRRGYLDWDGIQYVTKEFHQKLKKSQLRAGDLLFVRVGANRGDCCSVPEGAGEINCANIVFARPSEGNATFLERYCDSVQGRSQLLGMTTGSAQGVINTTSVAELIVPLPPLKEQKLIVERLNEFQCETQRLESIYQQKLTALDELKKSLLHQAFSGAL